MCDFTGLDKGMVSRYLETLKSLRIIHEEIPVTASPKFRKRLYHITDPYFNFWFRYIYPNKIDLEAYREQEVLALIQKDFTDYSGFMFEKLIMQMVREKRLLNKFNFAKVGRWWHKDKEIDFIALDEKTNKVVFGECKWSHKVNALKILEKLKQKADFVRWRDGKCEKHYAIFAKSFSKKVKDKHVYCFDLKDLGKLFQVT